jgi:hypothetical protein
VFAAICRNASIYQGQKHGGISTLQLSSITGAAMSLPESAGMNGNS